MQNLLEMGAKNHKAWLKWKVSFITFCLLVCLWAIAGWSRSSFGATLCAQASSVLCWCPQNNWSCTEISPFSFTDCNKTHLCYNFFIPSICSGFIDLNDTNESKWHLKCPRNFRPPPWILPKKFIFTQCSCIRLLFHPQSKNIQMAP